MLKLADVVALIQSYTGKLKTEINSKLDSPETAGTEGQILVSDGEGGQTWEDNKGITQAIKTAILDCFAHVAWIGDSGHTYYEALEDALSGGGTKTLVSISVVYTPGIVYENDNVDSLKNSLVVTALYDDSSVENVSDYTLSGTLQTGTSTITVTYEGKTTTFTVAVYGFTPQRTKTVSGSNGSPVYIGGNSKRCLNLGTFGYPDEMTYGNLNPAGVYPVPIRAGVSKIYADLGDDITTTLQIIEWDDTNNIWKKKFGGEWTTPATKEYSLTSYNDGTYFIAIVSAKYANVPGDVDGSYDFTNHVFSKYDIHFE